MLDKNEFGKLVRAYRKQRGWKQDELADRWGHTRAYVSQVELGKRTLDRSAQLSRLADILDIPSEKLEAIGRGIPERKVPALEASQSDNALLQMLLAPGRDMVKFSWLAWFGDAAPNVEEHLRELVLSLDQTLTSHRGELVKPAQQLLAYAHQMMGKIAFDKLDYAAASGHFGEMQELGVELNDPDIITSAMIHLGDILRKRGRFETAVRCFEAAKVHADIAAPGIQGMRHQIMARAFSSYGDEERFLRSINSALEIAEHTKDNIDNLANQFNKVECLQEQAQGFTMLWKPNLALDIYKQTDALRTFRPLRDLGSYSIVKAQAYGYAGDLDRCLDFSLKGFGLASQYRSKRHVARLGGMYSRLSVTRMGKDKRLKEVREALVDTQKKQEEW